VPKGRDERIVKSENEKEKHHHHHHRRRSRRVPRGSSSADDTTKTLRSNDFNRREESASEREEEEIMNVNTHRPNTLLFLPHEIEIDFRLNFARPPLLSLLSDCVDMCVCLVIETLFY
jgi:hypothetical protein